MTEVIYSEAKPVDGYGPGFFRVGGEKFTGALTILPRGIASWDGFEDMATLTAAASDIDVLFVGTGAEVGHIPSVFRSALEDAGIGVEIMSSPSACRTYNVLLAEGRRIGVALLPV